VHIAAFFSLRPHWLLWVTMVERPSSWSYVVLPCWLSVRYPSRSEPEMPINGGVPRLCFYSWARSKHYEVVNVCMHTYMYAYVLYTCVQMYVFVHRIRVHVCVHMYLCTFFSIYTKHQRMDLIYKRFSLASLIGPFLCSLRAAHQ